MTIHLAPLITALGTAALLSAAANAAEHRIECPAEIPRKSIAIVSPPDGWTPFVPFEFSPGLPLVSAGLMWGEPSTMTISKPNFAGTVRGQEVEKWTQLSEMVGVEKWMACFYGENGQHDVILSKRLDNNTIGCTVTYLKKNTDKVVIVIDCQW
jgi:hypothetical protein